MDVEGLLSELRSIREELAKINQRLSTGEQTLLSFPQAASRLGIGTTKLRDLVAKGALVVTPLGRRKMVALSEIERLSRPTTTRATRLPAAPRARKASKQQTQDPSALRQFARRQKT